MTEFKEPEIIINGINIGIGCSMTLRVAIESFASDLVENGLGDDEMGKKMCKEYRKRIDEIRKAMKVIK